jgi:hypothetical protein
MEKLIKMPSIGQFRDVVSSISRHYNFVGVDENGNAIYDDSLAKPIITFKSTVKLHGTNSGVSGNFTDGDLSIWSQSKGNIITPQSDNSGFAFFVESNKALFEEMISSIYIKENLDIQNNTVTIYGEFVGKGIQKGVGICNLPKSLFIFGVKITPHTTTEEELRANPAYWVDSSYLRSIEHKIYNIEDYPTFDVVIDFNNLELSQNEIVDLTIAVENECPVSKCFGFPDTIGEGLVFNCDFKGVRYTFKSKGDKHSNSKVKVLKQVDNEQINKCIVISQKVCPAWRLDQMLNETFDILNGGQIDIKKMGTYIKAVVNDIIKEELLTISDGGLEIKDITKYISEISRNFFVQRLNESVGLK